VKRALRGLICRTLNSATASAPYSSMMRGSSFLPLLQETMVQLWDARSEIPAMLPPPRSASDFTARARPGRASTSWTGPPSWSGSSSTAALRAWRDYRDQRALAGLEHEVGRLAIAAAHREHLELLQLLGDVRDLEHGIRERHGRASQRAGRTPRRGRCATRRRRFTCRRMARCSIFRKTAHPIGA